MIPRIANFIRKNDHFLLIAGLILFIATPIWQGLFNGSEILLEWTIIWIIVSGLSVIYYQGNNRFNLSFKFGVFVIGISVINFIFNLGDVFNIIVQYLHVAFFLILTLILFNLNVSAKSVTLEVVINSISGYLLLGISWAIIIAILGDSDPNAFSLDITDGNAIYNEIYFSFVSLTTLGYGDILPVSPTAKVISVFISITGAFYNTIVLGLIVGKFISTQTNKLES